MVIRRKVSESPEYRRKSSVAKQVRLPLFDLVRNHPRILITMIVISGVPAILNYLVLSYSIAFGTGFVGYSRDQMLLFGVVISGSTFFIYPFLALVVDRVGPRRVLIGSALLQIVAVFVFFAGFTTGNYGLAVLCGVFAIVPIGLAGSAMPAAFSDVFATEIRYTGISLTYQIGAAVCGGLAPLIATLLYARTGTSAAVGVYVGVAALVMLIATLVKWPRATSTVAAAEPADGAGPATDETTISPGRS